MGFGKRDDGSPEEWKMLIEISSSEDSDEEEWVSVLTPASERGFEQSSAGQKIVAGEVANMATSKRLSYDIDTLLSLSGPENAVCNVSKFSADAWKENILKHIPKSKSLMEETEGIDPKLPQLPRADRLLFPPHTRKTLTGAFPEDDPKFAEFKKRVASPPSKFVTPGGAIVPVPSDGPTKPSVDYQQGQANLPQPLPQSAYYNQMVVPQFVGPQTFQQPVLTSHMLAPHIMSPMIQPVLNYSALPSPMLVHQTLPSNLMVAGHPEPHLSGIAQAAQVQYLPGAPPTQTSRQPVMVVNGSHSVSTMPAVGMQQIYGSFVYPHGQMNMFSAPACSQEHQTREVLPMTNNIIAKPVVSQRQHGSSFQERLDYVTRELKEIDKHIARFRENISQEQYKLLVERRRCFVIQRDEIRRSLEELDYLEIFKCAYGAGIPRPPNDDEAKEPWALKSDTDPRLAQSMLEQIRTFGTPILRPWFQQEVEKSADLNDVNCSQTEEEMEEAARQARLDIWAFDVPEAWELRVRGRWVFGCAPAPNKERLAKYKKTGNCLPDGIIEYLRMKELIARCPRNDGIPLLPESCVSQWVDANGIPIWKLEAAAPTDAFGNKVIPTAVKFWQEGKNKPLSVFETWARGINPLYWRPLTQNFSEVRAAVADVVKIVNARHLHFSSYGDVIWGGFSDDPHTLRHSADKTYVKQISSDIPTYSEEEVKRYRPKVENATAESKGEGRDDTLTSTGRSKSWLTGFKTPVQYGSVFLAQLLKDPRYSSCGPKPSGKEGGPDNVPVTPNNGKLSNKDAPTKENKNPSTEKKTWKMSATPQRFTKARSSVSGPSAQAVARFPCYDGAADSLSQKTSSSTTEHGAAHSTTAGPSSSASSATVNSVNSGMRSDNSSSPSVTTPDVIRPKDVTLNRSHHNRVEHFFKTLREEERDEIAKYKAQHPSKR